MKIKLALSVVLIFICFLANSQNKKIDLQLIKFLIQNKELDLEGLDSSKLQGFIHKTPLVKCGINESGIYTFGTNSAHSDTYIFILNSANTIEILTGSLEEDLNKVIAFLDDKKCVANKNTILECIKEILKIKRGDYSYHDNMLEPGTPNIPTSR